MSPKDGGTPPEQERIERNIRRTVGRRALGEIRDIVDDESRANAANQRFLRAFLKFGLPAMVLASLGLAHLLGVF